MHTVDVQRDRLTEWAHEIREKMYEAREAKLKQELWALKAAGDLTRDNAVPGGELISGLTYPGFILQIEP